VNLTGATLVLSPVGNPNRFAPNPAFVSEANMRQTAPLPADQPVNVHLFSFVLREPVIASRVINETAAVITYLNETVLGK
jgi:hypothetical protein